MLIHRNRAASLPRGLMLLLVLAGFAASTVQSKEVKVSGMGIRKCAEWQQWKVDRNGEARALVVEWTQGFIAGHNIYARSGTDAANSVVADAKVLITLLDSYCQKNPGSQLLAGVVEITQSLGGARINLAPKSPAQPNPPPKSKSERDS